MFYLLLSFFMLLSCSDEDNPGPTSLKIGGNTELAFLQKGETKTIDIITNASDVQIIVGDDGKEWCTLERKGRRLNITATYNYADQERNTKITVIADQNTSVITVTQGAINKIIGGDKKLTISGATASSEEIVNEATGIDKSYDGDMATWWHTKWSDNTLPYIATYNLADADQLDYIIYYPRTVGANGRFGQIEIQVSTNANPEFVKVMDYDCAFKAEASKIVMPAPILNVKAVRFIIKTGQNNNATCSEMEFYKIVPGVVTIDVPLGGNSYLTAGSIGSVGAEGLINWRNPQTVFSTYFKVNKSGDLKLYLKYRADADGNVIDITAKGKTFTTTLPKPKVNKDTAIYIGAIEKVDAGYVKVDFKGVTLKGTNYAVPSSLLLSGGASEGMNFVGNFDFYWGRRGPSVHMGYTIPSGISAEWFYNEVTIPVGQDPIGSYFMANGFAEGYFGMQVNSTTERRVLFSVWSPYETDDPSSIPPEDQVKLVEKGPGVTVGSFGNEGSGGQSYLIYNWVAGNTYKFLNRIKPAADGYSEYTAYFYAPETGSWRLIAKFLRPKIQTYYKRPHSFVENFSPNVGYIGRKATYNNQWVYTVDGRWLELTEGTFTVDGTGSGGWRMDYKGGVDNSVFFLQNCGFFDEQTSPNSKFNREPTGNPPTDVFSQLN